MFYKDVKSITASLPAYSFTNAHARASSKLGVDCRSAKP